MRNDLIFNSLALGELVIQLPLLPALLSLISLSLLAEALWNYELPLTAATIRHRALFSVSGRHVE